MKLFFYYAFCSVKNQLRKLFKTWVAIFFAVCLLFGVLIGLGAAALDELACFANELACVFAFCHEVVGEGYGEGGLVVGGAADGDEQVLGELCTELECDVFGILWLYGQYA